MAPPLPLPPPPLPPPLPPRPRLLPLRPLPPPRPLGAIVRGAQSQDSRGTATHTSFDPGRGGRGTPNSRIFLSAIDEMRGKLKAGHLLYTMLNRPELLYDRGQRRSSRL